MQKRSFTPHHFSRLKVTRGLLTNKSGAGFTLIELLLVVGILLVLSAIAAPALRFFQKESDLSNSAEEIINTLRLAQNKTLASEGNSQWGIYFSTSTSPHQYTLFRGTNYAERADSFDEVHQLPKNVEIYEINLTGQKTETVFERISGAAQEFGTVSVRLRTDPMKSRIIYLENSGRAGFNVPSAPSDENRMKDSRHIHIDYTRPIVASTESLILTLEGGVIQTIIIANNIKDGQIDWEGEVSVEDEVQQLRIHTHRFNDFTEGTQFCIHRDRRYNSRALKIEISGDSSGFLVNYSADGLITAKTSIYALEPSWQ